MSEIKNLEPKAIWRNFDALTQVPRPSGHLDKVRCFLLNWAKDRKIDAVTDSAGNVIFRKPATAGMENRKMVTMQAHMDMVPQKVADSKHNFETDPIETYIDGDWVKAKGTTLGADDGMGVATIMAVMEDNSLVHGPLEALMTVDEETCMYGVDHLEADTLKGDILLNFDDETEGEMVIGSAGGVNLTASLDYKPVETDEDDVAIRISIKNLCGGHSGLEINEGRANANKLMARIVREAVAEYACRLVEWNGGNMRNAIAREAEVVLTLPKENIAPLKEVVSDWEEIFKSEFGEIEPDLSLLVEEVKAPKMEAPEEIQDNLINAIYAAFNGVMRFIPETPEIVETSSNLAIVNINEGKVMVKFLIRSSVDSMRQYTVETISSAMEMAGMKVVLSGEYPAWQPNFSSPIVKVMSDVYKKIFDVEVRVQVVHAGLECGVIGALYKEMDMVSFGPTLRSPHTPNERCFIPSVDRYYKFVVETLKSIPEK